MTETSTTVRVAAQTFSLNVFGNEYSSTTRGIAQHDGVFTAVTQTDSRDFKTLKGAVAFMARFGYGRPRPEAR